MSALYDLPRPDNTMGIDIPHGFKLTKDGWITGCKADMSGPMAFMQKGPQGDGHFGIAYNGQVPESCIDHYVGCHPEHLMEGFVQMDKPEGCQWMCRSRIKSIVNHMGSVLVELEPAT